MKIAIMQPTYLPWIGYFDLISQSDTFVFLDNVQFEKQSWQQRNRIKTTQGWQWLTIPVLQKLSQRIDEVATNNTTRWRDKHWKSISQNYSKAPYWGTHCDSFESVYKKEWNRLVDLNVHIIGWACEQLGVRIPLVKASEMNVAGEKVARLIDICRSLGANAYISPPGSATYIEQDNRFGSEGMELQYHAYSHPIYNQLYGEFVSHLSIVDLIFNEGPRSLEIIKSGRRWPSSDV